LIRNHGFLDGNKRIAHAAMEVFLVMNEFEISASVDEQESFMMGLAAGNVSRESLVDWLRSSTRKLKTGT
jgi:death-on-curing protein